MATACLVYMRPSHSSNYNCTDRGLNWRNCEVWTAQRKEWRGLWENRKQMSTKLGKLRSGPLRKIRALICEALRQYLRKWPIKWGSHDIPFATCFVQLCIHRSPTLPCMPWGVLCIALAGGRSTNRFTANLLVDLLSVDDIQLSGQR